MVVGGGVGGMKAAVVAAERGHRVTFYEAGRRLGGQVLLAEQLPGRAEFGGAVTNLLSEIERYGVQGRHRPAGRRRLRPSRSAQTPWSSPPGATPRVPELELMDDPVVLTAWDVINGPTYLRNASSSPTGGATGSGSASRSSWHSRVTR